MDKDKHIVTADSEGYFYCRAVDDILNYKKEQQICGKGCPCHTGYQDGMEGRFVCWYCEKGKEEKPALFPSVRGLDERLYKAYAYAAAAHAGQYRKGTKIPYMAHIIMTMNYAVELTADTEVLQAAILHDTVEDTWVTFGDLREPFGDRVVGLVAGMTENKRHGQPPAETWELRKREAVEQLDSKSLDVKRIVLADKTANLESIVKERKFMGERIWEKFNQTDRRKHEWYFRSLRERLGELNDTSVIKVYDKYLEILFADSTYKL